MTSELRTQRSRLLLGGATIVLTAASAIIISVSTADAWTHHGCKYSGSNPTIDYKFVNVTSRNTTAIETAQANWDGTSAPGYFRPDNAWRDSEVDIFDGNYSSTAWAWVSWSCKNNGVYTSNEVDLSINHNTTGSGSLTTGELAIVMVHELGHAYGLGHSSLTCSSPGPAVMRQGTGKFSCSGTAPWTNDVDGVHARY